MKTWIFWAGISFIIGGIISLALNLGVQGNLSMLEDLTGYAIGWMAVGAVLIAFSLVKGKKEES
jgi:drug/metabolite transporter (DMT)-like permease